jgi:hypothetical protein
MLLAILLQLALPDQHGLRAHSPEETRAAQCAVGAVAIADLPLVARKVGEYPTYYSDRATQKLTLLQLCPDLRTRLPKDFPIAGPAEYARLGVHILAGDPMHLFSIGQPTMLLDHGTATVDISYSCPGLCGGELRLTYQHDGKVWKRTGEPVLLQIS